uniref:Uncharacterized protein n=1 Tax=Spironucleus salmonicida TaxID=348837 RepID=V6LFX7_9EUKA|eukprot:EST43412.1 Hypothetical protein SS50377_16871 [Spironucleus salmonicida]
MKNCTKSIEQQVLYQTQNCFAICHSVNAQTGRVQGKIIPKFKITTKKVQAETGLTYHPLNQQETQNRLERILSNCFYKSAIIYINLQEQTQLYQTASSTISFSIRECYIVNFIKYYDSTTLFYQSGTVSETLLARIQANDHGVNLNNEKFVLHCSKVVKLLINLILTGYPQDSLLQQLLWTSYLNMAKSLVLIKTVQNNNKNTQRKTIMKLFERRWRIIINTLEELDVLKKQKQQEQVLHERRVQNLVNILQSQEEEYQIILYTKEMLSKLWVTHVIVKHHKNSYVQYQVSVGFDKKGIIYKQDPYIAKVLEDSKCLTRDNVIQERRGNTSYYFRKDLASICNSFFKSWWEVQSQIYCNSY